MDLSEDLQNRLDKYISGAMSKSEALEFEEEIEKDDVLKSEFNLQKNLSLGIAYHANEALRDKLSKIHDDVIPVPSPQGNTKSMQWRYLAIAASISVLIISYYLISDNNNQFYEQYYERPTFSIQRGNEASNNLNEAGLNFNRKKFGLAVKGFESYLIENPKNYNARFYLGISYLELGNVDKAIEALNIVINSQGPFLKDQSSWYLAMAYLKKDKSKAIDLLVALSKDKEAGKWQQLATSLLEEIE